MNTFTPISQTLKTSIIDAIKLIQKLDIDDRFVQISETKDSSLGDFQSSVLFSLKKIIGITTERLADLLIPEINKRISNFAEATLSGKGFISIFITNNTLKTFLVSLEKSKCLLSGKKINVNSILTSQKRNVIVDYSSPNIAKPMHVGHLRSSIIGDSIANLLEYQNQKVVRINHIGDWGTQFGLLISLVKQDNIDIYKISNSEELLNLYSEANSRKKNEDFINSARLEVVKLQSGDPENIEIWKHMCNISMLDFNKIYDMLNISINVMGESYYNSMLPSIASNLLKKNIAVQSEGAVCVFSKKFLNHENKPVPFIIQKNDKGFGYAATDLAAIQHRIVSMKADWVIYVTDSGQELHFSQLFDIADRSIPESENTKKDHVTFGTICKEDGKRIRTRDGDCFLLKDLIGDAEEKSLETLKEQEAFNEFSDQEAINTSKTLAIGAIKFSDLICNRKSSYVFNIDRMFQINGKSSVFINYTYVRIKSILKKVNCNEGDVSAIKLDIDSMSFSEKEIVRFNVKFIDMLASATSNLSPHIIAKYAFDLSGLINSMLEQCKILGSAQENSRLALLDVNAKIINKCMSILGITLVNKM